MPCRALIDAFGIRIGGIPWTVQPIEVGFVVGNPLFDGQPGRFDGLHGFDIKWRRWRAWKTNDSFQKSVEAEEEFDLLAADDLADGFHGALAARALERVAAPNFQDEVTSQRAHVSGGLFGRCWDEEDFYFGG